MRSTIKWFSVYLRCAIVRTIVECEMVYSAWPLIWLHSTSARESHVDMCQIMIIEQKPRLVERMHAIYNDHNDFFLQFPCTSDNGEWWIIKYDFDLENSIRNTVSSAAGLLCNFQMKRKMVAYVCAECALIWLTLVTALMEFMDGGRGPITATAWWNRMKFDLHPFC